MANNAEVLILAGAVATGTGNGLNNTLIGNDAANTLDGGAGNDSLVGGAGNDSYLVDSTTDAILEASASGTDSVLASITGYTLGNNAEVLILAATVAGGTGNGLANSLIGNSAANTLDGGAGNDTLVGLTGNDYYVIDTTSDVVVEASAAGTDSVSTNVTGYTLADNAEVLILAGTVAAGTGNSLANTIIGNEAANTLNGGAGIDSLVGGAGNDYYVIDVTSDVVVEASDSGTDSVSTNVTGYTLAGNAEVLILAGTVATGTGNGLNNTLIGNDAANTLDGGAGNDSLVGGAGNDSYLVDSTTDAILEASASGTDSVLASITGYTLGNNAEVLILAGTVAAGAGNSLANTLIGNSAANTLNGLDGNDWLDGGAGNDTLNGGKGNDYYVIDNASDVIVDVSGVDSVLAGFTGYTLVNDAEVLILAGTVAGGTGNSLANTLIGNSSANTLDGGAGIDSLVGGAGNDFYVVDLTSDKIFEASASGTDSVLSKITKYTLVDNTEVLILDGTLASGTGNSLANTLVGNAADNVLNGGAGIDSLVGGAGNDYYFVDSTTDAIFEAAAAGTDSVSSSITGYTLAANAEVLILAGTVAAGTGNSLANTLIGNATTNTLDGGAGNDFYIVDNVLDSIQETTLVGGGTDSVLANVTGYTLADNAEFLILAGTVAAGTGNSLANTLIGNAATNSLDGGAGNDFYFVNSKADVVIESGASGTDSVSSSITGYTLADNAEVLILEQVVAVGTGNSLGNRLIGNSVANTLNGGAGIDTLVGDLGNDFYIVDNVLDSIQETTLAGGGTDTVLANVTGYTLAANTEGLILAESVVAGTGNSLANTLTGNASANSLDGGAGIDSLVGGAGNDTYFIDNLRDIVSETEENGNDLIVSSISYALKNNLENLQLTGAAWSGSGNSVANVITGNSLANRLNGLQGADTLIGGGGNDIFVVDNAGDSVLGGIGIDAVESRISSYTLGSTIENLILLGSQATNGTGNSLSNAIYGNDLNNRLNGVVGSSTLGDFLFGGEGDDTLVVNSSLDYTEGGDGTDLVETTVDYVLGEEVENLTLLGSALVGEGNDLDNVITGNSLGNTLKGQNGNDYLDGGQGNDVYIIDELDVVSETADNGVDTVMVSFEYATDWIVDDNIENIVVVGNAATIVRGNTIDNDITGSDSDNVLDGMVGDDTLKGGDGADSLFGGEGYDMFYGGDGNDTIVADVYDFVIDGGTGSDWMISGSDLDLSDGRTVNIENIALNDLYELNSATGDTSLAEYQPTTAIGNSLDNQLWGNMVANILVGGVGSDLLSGGGGNDTLTIDASDSLIDGGDDGENGGDWVLSKDSVSLIDGRIYGVENIVLTGISDTSAEGDDSDNKIFGNDGDNTLNGGYGSDYIDGGLGDDSIIGGNDGLDTFVGGGGNDTLLFQSAANVACFDGGDGVDYIVSNVNATMENMYSVETIILTGSEALTAEGNFEQNLIIGNSGSNTITGGGNFDTLTGNGAADLFVIGNASGNFYGNDLESDDCFVLITDFAVGVDSLQLFGASSAAYAINSTNPSQVLITSTDASVGLVAKINVVSGTPGNILNNASFLS